MPSSVENRDSIAGSPRDPILWIILALAALLLFFHLGGRYFWQDEAETILLGKSILRSGAPYASDGTNVVSQEAGREFGPDFLWRWSPWLQYYVAAGSIGLLGTTPLAARLPFALLGLLTVPLVFVLARDLFGSRRVARLSALCLATSVPFLLHARQARWHAPAFLLATGFLLGLTGTARGRRGSRPLLVASATALFYTNYLVAIGLLVAAAVAAPVLKREKGFLKPLLVSLGITGLLILPGAVFFDLLGKDGGVEIQQVLLQIWVYGGSYVTHLLPLPLLALALYLALEGKGLSSGARSSAGFLLVLSFVYVVVISCAPWSMFRYLSVLIPAAAVLLGWTLSAVFDWSRPAGWALLPVLLLTNVLQLTPLGFLGSAGTLSADSFPILGPIGSPLLGYLYELTHGADDPEAALCRYLQEHGRPGQVVLITYADLPLQLCTGLKVVGGLQGQMPPTDPDWIIARHFIVSDDPGKDADLVKFIQARIDPTRYETIELPVPDLVAPGSPEPALHYFRTPAGEPPLILLRRKQAD